VNYNANADIADNDLCIYPIVEEPVASGDSSELGFGPGWERCDCSHQVKNLQRWLNIHGFTLANKGLGAPGIESECFGYLSEISIYRFQETYRDLILEPNNISKPTGYYGAATHRVVQGVQDGTIPLRTPVTTSSVAGMVEKQAVHPEGHEPRMESQPGSLIKVRGEVNSEQDLVDAYVAAKPDSFTDSSKEIKKVVGKEEYKQIVEEATGDTPTKRKTLWQWIKGLFR